MKVLDFDAPVTIARGMPKSPHRIKPFSSSTSSEFGSFSKRPPASYPGARNLESRLCSIGNDFAADGEVDAEKFGDGIVKP